MSPTQKNTLKIGGALIVIALLLVCGPLSDRWGGGSKVEEAPPVAAGPPVDETEPIDLDLELDSIMAGALVGNSVDDIEPVAEPDISGNDELPIAMAAPVVVAAATTGGSGGSTPQPPPVSAGVPDTPVAASAPPPIPPVDPAQLFDDSTGRGEGAGPAKDVFPPPVAQGPLGVSIEPFDVANSELRPCASAGSGCQSLVGSGVGPIPGGAIRPFGAGNPRGGTP